MTLQELLEHAHLDALGQLDEREQAAFEAAFAVAPPGVKAQIRREQERWAPMEHLLPQVEPPPELRERVLDAVTAAMVSQGAGELSLRPSQRVAPAWRTASIGLMTAVLVMGGTFFYVFDTERQTARDRVPDLTREYAVQAFQGDVVSAMTDPKVERRAFVLASGQASGPVGLLWTKPDWKHAHLAFDHLPKSTGTQQYRVVVLDEKDQIGEELDHFTSNGILETRGIKSQRPETRLALVSTENGENHIIMTVTV